MAIAAQSNIEVGAFGKSVTAPQSRTPGSFSHTSVDACERNAAGGAVFRGLRRAEWTVTRHRLSLSLGTDREEASMSQFINGLANGNARASGSP
jgi:hypothetical protein